ncbi:hypothetical protein [Streptomyces sp. NPDC052042]
MNTGRQPSQQRPRQITMVIAALQPGGNQRRQRKRLDRTEP